MVSATQVVAQRDTPSSEAPGAARGAGASWRSVLLASLPGILLASAVLLPFLGKAFTIDDTFFMRTAQQALRDPLHPTAFDYTWTERTARVSQVAPTGPVIAWLLVPAAAAGGQEWVAHLTVLALLWLGIVATVALGSRLGLELRWAAAAGALLAAGPAVLGMAGTAMPDVPAMAFGVLGVERLVAWRQEGRPGQGLLGAGFLALAALTRTHAALALGVGFAMLAPALRTEHSPRRRARIVLPLLLSPVLVLAVSWATRDPLPGAGGILRTAASLSELDGVRLLRNLVAVPVHWSAALPFALPWLVLRAREVVRSPGALGAATLGAAATVGLFQLEGRPSPLALVAAAAGSAALWDAVALGIRRRDAVHLGLALSLLLPWAALPYVHVPAKFAVFSAPFAAVLLVRELRAAGIARRAAVACVVPLGVALAVAILRADATVGELGRRAAAELIVPNVQAGHRVWFAGHWGFQWYAENAGARILTAHPPYPDPGDLVVVHYESGLDKSFSDALAGPSRLRALRVLPGPPGGGRVMDSRLNVGFYSNVLGLMPWGWTGRSGLGAVLYVMTP